MLWRLRPMCVSSASVDAPSYPWLANTCEYLDRLAQDVVPIEFLWSRHERKVRVLD